MNSEDLVPGKEYVIERGVEVAIGVYRGTHKDPKYGNILMFHPVTYISYITYDIDTRNDPWCIGTYLGRVRPRMDDDWPGIDPREAFCLAHLPKYIKQD